MRQKMERGRKPLGIGPFSGNGRGQLSDNKRTTRERASEAKGAKRERGMYCARSDGSPSFPSSIFLCSVQITPFWDMRLRMLLGGLGLLDFGRGITLHALLLDLLRLPFGPSLGGSLLLPSLPLLLPPLEGLLLLPPLFVRVQASQPFLLPSPRLPVHVEIPAPSSCSAPHDVLGDGRHCLLDVLELLLQILSRIPRFRLQVQFACNSPCPSTWR